MKKPVVLGQLATAAVALVLLGAAPAQNRAPAQTLLSFAPATQQKLPNGVIVASQPSHDLPIIGGQFFIPAGLVQQPAQKEGVASVTAALVLHTPVDGKTTLEEAVTQAGGSISYTLDPTDVRYYLEARTSDFARLSHDLRVALRQPDVSQLAAERQTAVALANAQTGNPLVAAYVMVRQVQYHGTGFAGPDQGNSLAIRSLSQEDVQSFVSRNVHGVGAIVALEGDVSPSIVDALARDFGSLPAGGPVAVATASPVSRLHQVVAHRTTSAPWVAVGYDAPDQYSSDFATMLVIEALLGSGGDVHALNYASNEIAPQDFVGAYYQYEASPGSMIVFLGGGTDLDQSVRDLELGVARLRADSLSSNLIATAKKTALGDYYSSTTRLDDLAWLLGRAAASPEGVAFENNVPQRVMAVRAADIQRVARRYLTKRTIAIVLPQVSAQ